MKPIKRYEVISHDHETVLPLHVPETSLNNIKNKEKLLELIVKGPDHEILYTLILLQVIESIIALDKAA